MLLKNLLDIRTIKNKIKLPMYCTLENFKGKLYYVLCPYQRFIARFTINLSENRSRELYFKESQPKDGNVFGVHLKLLIYIKDKRINHNLIKSERNLHGSACFLIRQSVDATRNNAILSTWVTVDSSTTGTTSFKSVNISASFPLRSRAAYLDVSRRLSMDLL